MLWMVEKDFRWRWCHGNNQYVNASSKYIKNYVKNNRHILSIGI